MCHCLRSIFSTRKEPKRLRTRNRACARLMAGRRRRTASLRLDPSPSPRHHPVGSSGLGCDTEIRPLGERHGVSSLPERANCSTGLSDKSRACISFRAVRPRANFRDAGEAETQRVESAGRRRLRGLNRPPGRFGFTRVSVKSVSNLRRTALVSHKTPVAPQRRRRRRRHALQRPFILKN